MYTLLQRKALTQAVGFERLKNPPFQRHVALPGL